jgi:hypothetical protein
LGHITGSFIEKKKLKESSFTGWSLLIDLFRAYLEMRLELKPTETYNNCLQSSAEKIVYLLHNEGACLLPMISLEDWRRLYSSGLTPLNRPTVRTLFLNIPVVLLKTKCYTTLA